jgi:ubiquitin carboxyl-terminal hydrolase 25/28
VCSCMGCNAKLEIIYRPPRLEISYFELLIGQENLRDRFEQAVRQDPERQTLQQQPGIKVLEALSSYLRESLQPTRADASVPADNKRFMTSFGNDCDTLLQWLGFSKKDPIIQNGVAIEPALWTLPKAPPRNAFVESSRNILEDVMEELHAKIRQYPNHEQKTLKHPPPYPTPLVQPLESILGCKDYARAESRFRKPDYGVDEYYLGLGAVPDFADSLVHFCFQRQIAHLADTSAYFFDCLSGIAQKRETDELEMAVGMLASEGYVSQEEVLQAYRYLGFRPDETLNISDDQVLGSFNSRLESSPRHQETELREKLLIIARARGSASLVSAADNGKSQVSSSPLSVVCSEIETQEATEEMESVGFLPLGPHQPDKSLGGSPLSNASSEFSKFFPISPSGTRNEKKRKITDHSEWIEYSSRRAKQFAIGASLENVTFCHESLLGKTAT